MSKRSIANILSAAIPVKKWRRAVREKIYCYLKRRYRIKHMYEYMLVQQSNLFDDAYYLYHYSPLDNDGIITPVEHYLMEGWKKGYNPSEKFNNNKYLYHYNIQENPLVHFLEYGRYYGLVCYFDNHFAPKESLISSYLQHRAQRISKKAVYTCITGQYDNLVQQQYINADYDYICFTDNQEWLENTYRGMWEIRPLQKGDLDNARINRFHKINAHLVLSEYHESIYIDGNINILTSHYFEKISEYSTQNILLAKHFFRNCLYWESFYIIHRKEYDFDKIKAQVQFMKKENFPEHYGMSENNIIYRKHHDPQVVKAMENWWHMVQQYSKRDQCSLSYALWKNGINAQDCIRFPNTRHDLKNFALIQHSKAESNKEA